MADTARLNGLRGGNRSAATRLINRINNILADAALSRTQKIHELQSKVTALDAKLTAIEGYDAAIFNEIDDDDLQAEMDDTDASNQTIRDASDNFMFQLKTLQDAEDAANATLALATAPVVTVAATPGSSATHISIHVHNRKYEKGDLTSGAGAGA
ncbi:hypothetical protein DAPPUDRAFT_333259 [Daphnia pulex]|uniref:Uncharacterized protein n=1 Tax=Daphnia pulex TaxID=6669 RepID=E9HSC5_DAPPU|nr:hypothetical protein DAPPUDRAFT_333259 [Daphnia pulex]|eukprot:EFX65344.1 hypothetical protein DAPPUDRAFT_333259 [Daphnia pulex]